MTVSVQWVSFRVIAEKTTGHSKEKNYREILYNQIKHEYNLDNMTKA